MNKNSLLNFTLEGIPIRGSIVFLSSTWDEIYSGRDYPDVIKTLLGELLTCSTLLSSMVKLNGNLSIQIQGKGLIEVLVAETNCQDDEINLRGTAKFSEKILDSSVDNSLKKILNDALLAITLDPKLGGKRYQSIVPVIGENIEDIFEDYLMKSEQIESKIAIFNTVDGIGGIILQKLPENEIEDLMPDDGVSFEYDYSSIMTNIKDNIKKIDSTELHKLNFEKTLTKVVEKFDVRIFDYQSTKFVCGCSREKIERVLLTLGKVESEQMIKEQGNIVVTCEFCMKVEKFDSIDIGSLFSSTSKTTNTLN